MLEVLAALGEAGVRASLEGGWGLLVHDESGGPARLPAGSCSAAAAVSCIASALRLRYQ